MYTVAPQRFSGALLTLCLFLLSMVCSGVAAERKPVTLLVAAAADVAPAFKDIGAQFTRDTGIQLNFNIAASGQLVQQIESGAPVDLFAAANVAFIDKLASQGRLVAGSKALYARGLLTLWWLPQAGLHIERLEDLLQPTVKRIALANPVHAPYGMAARQALQTAGLWEPLQAKLVLGENVLQALQYAATGNVDVAIISRSLSDRPEGKWLLVPEAFYTPLLQALAVIQGSKHVPEAQQLAQYITGPHGQAILQRHGFLAPPQELRQ